MTDSVNTGVPARKIQFLVSSALADLRCARVRGDEGRAQRAERRMNALLEGLGHTVDRAANLADRTEPMSRGAAGQGRTRGSVGHR